MMRKIQTQAIKSLDVKQEALDDIYAHFDEFHKTTVWQEECRSWFKDGKVKNRIYLWPGSVSFSNHSSLSPFHTLAHWCGVIRVTLYYHRRATLTRTIITDHPFPQNDQGAPSRGLQHPIQIQEPLRFLRQRRGQGACDK